MDQPDERSYVPENLNLTSSVLDRNIVDFGNDVISDSFIFKNKSHILSDNYSNRFISKSSYDKDEMPRMNFDDFTENPDSRIFKNLDHDLTSVMKT